MFDNRNMNFATMYDIRTVAQQSLDWFMVAAAVSTVIVGAWWLAVRLTQREKTRKLGPEFHYLLASACGLWILVIAGLIFLPPPPL